MDFNEEDELLEEETIEEQSSEGFANEEDANPSSSEQFSDEELLNEEAPKEEASPLEEADDTDIEVEKAVAEKGILSVLFKKFWFWVMIGVILVFIIVLSLPLDFDWVGVGNPKPELYPTPACGKVYLTWENESYTKQHKDDPDYEPITDPSLVDINDEERFTYKEYAYDDFVAGVIWTDNDEAKDVDNEIMYQAMAIAARSELIATLPDNCVVLKNYNEQAQRFNELDGSEEKYAEIMAGVRLSNGMIIGRKGSIISAKYEPFHYVKKRMEEDNRKYFYHMKNENEREQQVVPAYWVDEIEQQKGEKIPKVKVAEYVKLESMSLYGGKYLLEKVDSQYDLYQVLEYYYGRDIEYYTISTAFSDQYLGDGCSAISMNSTSLSREEFIKWAEQYAASHSKAGVLADNAGMIYDMATSNGINPELVFVRADVEGYSPGSSKNNYWGMGCTNTGGYDACISYSSLSSGVAGFLNYISKYSSLNDLMSKYAYLGDYWYNPGSWGTGGCVYASAIYGSNIPDRVRDACSSGKTCTTSGGGDCVPTTDEDKQAYLTYQSRTMVDARERIFGLGADVCVPSYGVGEAGTGACNIWRQGDERWGSIHLGSSTKSTMRSSGCAVTSVAIAMACSGTQINNVASFNPGTLVNLMNSSGGFQGANILWGNSAITTLAPAFRFVKSESLSGSNTEKIQQVIANTSGTNSVILHFKNSQHPRGHYVVLKTISSENFVVYDPADGKINTYQAADLDQMVIYQH